MGTIQNWPLPKDPDDSCPLRFDWSKRLPDGETITAAVVSTTSTTVEVSEGTIDGAFVTFRVDGGVHGEVADILCRVTFSNGDQGDQTAKLRIRTS